MSKQKKYSKYECKGIEGGNVGGIDKKVTLPHYMAMFL